MTSSPDEVERLHAEVTRLQRELDAARGDGATPPGAAPPPGEPRHGVWRPIVVGILLVLTALLAPLAIVATWAHDEISDTDRYVQTITPLASDPAVQTAIADRVTTEIFNRLDVKAVTDQAVDALASRGLPEQAATSLAALSTPLENSIRNFVHDKVLDVVQSDAFKTAWDEVNRTAHSQMVTVLTGETGGAVEVSGNAVNLNLAVVIETVKNRLVDAGFALASKIPTVNAQFTIVQSDGLAKAQTIFHYLELAARTLPVLALLLLGLAVFLGRSRRTTLVVGALVVAASMILLGFLLNLFRVVYLDAIPSDQLPQDAAAAVYDTLTHFIRLNLRAVLVVFLAVAVIAWVGGAAAGPAAVRRGTRGALDRVRHARDRTGLNTGPVGAAAWTYRTPLRATILGGALLIYVMAAHPTGAFALTVLACAAALLLIVEVVARPAVAPATPPE